MTTSATALVQLSMPGPLALKVGNTIRTIAGVGTAQAGAANLTVNQALLTTSGGQTAFLLTTQWEVGDEVSVYNTSATSALIYPQSGGAIDGGSTDASVSVAQNAARTFLKVSATAWRSVASSLSGSTFTTITVDAIAGGDSSLGITGQAAAQGGAVVVTGGTSSTAGNAGGAVSQVGGTPGATGVGGAASVTGGIGGATSGSGGAASLTGGAGTNGNATGGVATVAGGAGQGTGNGAAASVTGGASGDGATGNGATASLTGGAALSTNGNGGAAIVAGGALAGTGKKGAVFTRGAQITFAQGDPAAKTVTAAISAAELVGGLITTTGATAPSIHQLPTGTLIDAELPGIATGDAFDFSIINTGTGASDDATITVNTDVTIVGNPTVGALTDATIISGSGRFRARRSAANTYVVYRLA